MARDDKPTPVDFGALQQALSRCMSADLPELRRRLATIEQRLADGKPFDRTLDELVRLAERSSERWSRRVESRPSLSYPEALPVAQRREEILESLRTHQVIILCGETGSGKTTQLPKLCLELGRGSAGMIGHTQPRRIAARSVATRIAEELGCSLGQQVGYKVRFGDQVGPDSLIKLMTDGILLAEIQSDPLLTQYDTLIIDEAHERSLNIDFLLGYLKRILPERPDLKLIVTSATIDPERFSRHFDDAPIVTVSGRTYPVELRYRPIAGDDEDERDRDLQQALLDAVDELTGEGTGDVLIFLSGEREIRESAEALRKHHPPGTEILPLFARLSAAEQNRVFQPHGRRRIVLATNVAETSLTVPGIRYVVDPGMARISRYSPRSKIQRLPIEPISQASADQRKGRCGRIEAGICIRLYSEEAFEARPRFTDPEILRTNLAAVILQMASLGLGRVEAFPFVDPPDAKQVRDGFQLLFELGAVDEQNQITRLGRDLSKLPIDPRLGRMILAALKLNCGPELLIIASALAIQDPRERPLEKQQQSDQAHARFRDERSDFLTLLNLWHYYHHQARHLSKAKLRTLCRNEFLSFVRMREWHELHQQLLGQLHDMGLLPKEASSERKLKEDSEFLCEWGYPAIHRALLSGLLGHLGMKDERQEFLGARNRRFHIFPGSGLFKKPPKWVMAAELVETTKVYARTNARVDPLWVEGIGDHLIKRSYFEPHWEKSKGQVAAYERLTLYGLIINPKRRINYGPIDPLESRRIFIRRALVEGDFNSDAPFFRHNRALVEEIEELESKTRRRDLLADDEVLYDFYQARVPEGCYSKTTFETWRKEIEQTEPQRLFLTRELLMQRELDEETDQLFPTHLAIDGMRLPLEYHFEPGQEQDGVTVTLPLVALGQIAPERFEWLVPGLLEEKIAALIKTLPKSARRNFVPVPEYARACRQALTPDERPLLSALTEQLRRMSGVEVADDLWSVEALPDHLFMHFRVVDIEGQTLDQGRSLAEIQARLSGQVRESFDARPTLSFERDEVTDWAFGALPENITFENAGITLQGYPALVLEEGERVALRVLDSAAKAQSATRDGLRRLYALNAKEPVKYLRKNLPDIQRLCLQYSKIDRCEHLKRDITLLAMDRAFEIDAPLPESREQFQQRVSAGGRQLLSEANALCALLAKLLPEYVAIRKRLHGNLPLSWIEAAQDIDDQLNHLIYPGFLLEIPLERLEQLPRYLTAINRRLDKLDREPDKDRLRRAEILPLWERFKQRAGPGRVIIDPELTRYRWMLEEWRVQLFAQELGTAGESISAKRLEKQWGRVG